MERTSQRRRGAAQFSDPPEELLSYGLGAASVATANESVEVLALAQASLPLRD